jgi:hypothetical protein
MPMPEPDETQRTDNAEEEISAGELVTRFYLRYVLEPLFRLAWEHVPWFADYCVEFVNQVQRAVHKRLMRPDYVEQLRQELMK